ncbi:hypothetical protein K2173_017536 [Erythroxylum novogranatense]|uniref:AP2/ERF domain-containing protein n=1 Tax=Erythroxylum novogranatense TaxID=1862640 RepID=A0AAV8TKZ6_9ROSI|nr:hypothetical protein K2173_017536 [Erythroxylum novogranatense]
MESSTRHQTGSLLGFSLSNHRVNINHNNSSHCSQLSLFEVFNSTSSSGSVSLVSTAQEEDTTAGRATVDLSVFSCTGAPKLEDFLGGSTATATATAPPPPHQSLAHQFSTATPVSTLPDTGIQIYDSELKTLAASFLRGYSTSEQTDNEKQHQPLVEAEHAPKKSVDTFGQRTSIYRGVTRHRWTGRYEAHLWDNSCKRQGQSRKGRQVYLGGYDKEEKAARAYDLAALKYWGPTTTTNFPVSNYRKELEEMKHMTRQEFVASLRRKSSGFSRGASIYRGVTRHHQHGRWQARIGRVAGNKDLYLGTFSTQEEAAEAYDIAAIKFRGLNAVTNFDISRYDVKSIANSNLPVGGVSGKSKNSLESASDSKSFDASRSDDLSSASSVTFANNSQPAASTLSFAIPIKQDTSDYWSNIFGFQTMSTTTTSSPTLNSTKNTNVTVAPSTLFPGSNNNGPAIQNPPVFGMDFKAVASGNGGDHDNGLLFNPAFIQPVSSVGGVSTSSSSIPFAAPIAPNSSGSNFERDSIYGSWNAQSLHAFQSAKPNLSVFQTPIFGIE